jgi:hypothetical protein
MRTFLMILPLIFVLARGYGQGKDCPFAFKSITRPNSMQTQQLIKTLETLKLKTYYQADKIPGFITKALTCWIKGNRWIKGWSIADRGGPYNATDIIVDSLPRRQLLYIGLNDQYMLMAYNHGGMASNSPVLLFRFENEKIVSVMYWLTFNERVKTKRDVIKTLKRLRSFDTFEVPHM